MLQQHDVLHGSYRPFQAVTCAQGDPAVMCEQPVEDLLILVFQETLLEVIR